MCMCIRPSWDVFSGILSPGVWRNNYFLKTTVGEGKKKVQDNWQSFVMFKVLLTAWLKVNYYIW